MSDGPFNNSKLASCWKRLLCAVQNDATERAECGALASDAMVRDLLSDDMRALLDDLRNFASSSQLHLDSLASVEGIFDDHKKSQFADSLKKELAFRLGTQMRPELALGQALEAVTETQIGILTSRLEEECIRVRDSGEISQEQCRRTIEKIDASFDAIDRGAVCEALRVGNRTAFKETTAKKAGVDEGPGL